MKSEEPFSLEENLALTNDELKSNWVKLASLIRAYEHCTWDEAKAKASRLLKEKSADTYIDAIRAFPQGPPPEDQATLEPSKKENQPVFNSIYEGNYKRLLKVAPGLEDVLVYFQKDPEAPTHGKSESSVFMDLHLDILDKERSGYHIALSHYFKQNGDMVPNPDMRLLVDIKNKTVQALEFQNAMIYSRVYDDSYQRKLVNLREKNSQNKFLSQWLKNLIEQDHEIIWDEPEKEREAESEIIDNYGKTTEEEPEAVAQPEQKEKDMKNEEEKKPKSGKRIDPEKQVEKQKINGLEKSNYQKLLRVIIGFSERFPNVEDKLKLITNDPAQPVYEILRMPDKNKMVQKYVVYEHTSDKHKIGVLVIGIMSIRKLLMALGIRLNFFGLELYDDMIHDNEPQRKYQANKGLEKWLDFVIANSYYVEVKEAPIIEMKPEPEKPKETKPEPQPVDAIPDFEIGHVQLTDAHKRYGLTQKDINWINKHRQGMVLTPRTKEPIQNTKKLLVDLSMQAKRPGCRISATGKIYYEGRTNRSDLTNKGL